MTKKTKIAIGISSMLIVCLAFCADIIEDWFQEVLIQNFAVVDKGRIYRSGLPTARQLDYLCEEYKIATVISLSGDVTEEYKALGLFMEKRNLNHINLPLTTETNPPQQKIDTFLREISDSNNWPVLVHCGAGVDRTGMMIALYRMVNDGWQWDRAKEEALDRGFHDQNPEKGLLLETMPGIAAAYIASNKVSQSVKL